MIALLIVRVGVHEGRERAAIDDQPRDESAKLRWREEVYFKHGKGVRPDGAIPDLVDPELGDWWESGFCVSWVGVDQSELCVCLIREGERLIVKKKVLEKKFGAWVWGLGSTDTRAGCAPIARGRIWLALHLTLGSRCVYQIRHGVHL